MTSIKIFLSFKKPSEKEVKTAQIHLKACVERTAYVPGETIVFNGLVKTLGGSTIQRTSLTFIQVDSFMDSSRVSAGRAVFCRWSPSAATGTGAPRVGPFSNRLGQLPYQGTNGTE